MKKLIATAAAVLLLGLYIGATYNSFVVQENGITAQYDANKAILDKITQTIKGSGLAADKYSDVIVKAITAAMSGRYGSNGSGAAMQWIKESQPDIDPAVYEKLQVVVEANLAEWASAQVSLRDRDRVYKNQVGTLPRNVVAFLLGFPRIDMAKYERMIVTADTTDAFDSGTMKGVNDLLGTKKN